jgi:acetyl esterase/lipase
MSKSIGATIMSKLLTFWPKQTAEETKAKIAETLQQGERETTPPGNLPTRFEDNENGRVFYCNEKSVSRYTVFYIHGGAYRHDFVAPHWQFLEKLVKETNALVIAPAYRLVPFATYKEAYDLIVPLYRKYSEAHPEKKIILMGDSAGGGLSLSLAEYCRSEGLRLPDELILFSPWVDVSMENEDIRAYQTRDPFLFAESLAEVAKYWAADLDVHDPKVSPIYGDFKGFHNVTVFVGTDEIFYPDVTKFFHMLDTDVSNELIVGEGMNHVYPIFPIEESGPACRKVYHNVMR